jgi:sulfide dehydrogenase cytochrome subunit
MVIKNKNQVIVVLCALVSLAWFYCVALFAADAVDPAQLRAAVFASPCAGCHGTDGKSTGEIPALDHMSAQYIESAMKAFKSDQRPGTVMNRIAKGYTDEQIKLIAGYFEMKNKK